jgi:AraC family transcriptional regulator
VEPAVAHPYLIYHLSRPTQVTRKIEGFSTERALIGPRHICLAPGGSVVQTQHTGRPEILQVYIRRSVYETAVNEMYGTSDAEMLPRYAILDPLLEQLIFAIKRALQNGATADRLYMDTIAQMIAMHIARHHSTRSRVVENRLPGTIADWRMQRLFEFIEENLGCDLSLIRMAAEVGVSPLHLPRTFKTATGQSPHRYVLRRRIERAKDLLIKTDTPILEVALSVGFSSQSHLSSWFSRVVGISPADYRRQGYR